MSSDLSLLPGVWQRLPESTEFVRFSIVVVTKDNPVELMATLVSIAEQTVLRQPCAAEGDVEVIIVDSSCDCVQPQVLLDVLGDSPIIRLIHDLPPRGIFAAMNLALSISSGQLVQFLNAGDCFYDADVLAVVDSHWRRASIPMRVLFGQALVCPCNDLPVAPWPVPDDAVCSIRRWLRFYVPNHQSLFVDGVWARQHPFVLTAPQAADRLWMRAALGDGSMMLYLSRPLVRYRLGGVSSRLPDWATLRLRLSEPSRTLTQKCAELVKYMLRPVERYYPCLMAWRSRLIGLLV